MRLTNKITSLAKLKRSFAFLSSNGDRVTTQVAAKGIFETLSCPAFHDDVRWRFTMGMYVIKFRFSLSCVAN